MSKITESARDEPCLVRIPGYCNHRPDTTVGAHLNGAGMALKHSDLFIAYCCSDCHDVIDGRTKTGFSKAQIERMHMDGVVRTQQVLLDKGLIKLA